MPELSSPENAALMDGQDKNARDVVIIGSEGPMQASIFTHPSWWLTALGLVSAVAMVATLGALRFSSSGGGGQFGSGSKSFLQFDDELQAAPSASPWMATTWTTANATTKADIIIVKDASGLVEGMSIKIFPDQNGMTSEQKKIKTIDVDTKKVTLDSPLQHDYKDAVVNAGNTAGNTAWVSLGSDTACRVDPSDSTLSGHGSAQTYTGIPNLDACKHFCEQNIACTGVEFRSSTGYCEVWTMAIGYTVSKPGFECWRHGGEVCDVDLLNSQLMWSTRKKLWCCYQEGKGCSNAKQEPDYSAGDGWEWVPKKHYDGLQFNYWDRKPYDCSDLDGCATWSRKQKHWCWETEEKDCSKNGKGPGPGKYWQEVTVNGFSSWENATEGYYWKQVDGTLRQVAFDCNADLDRFERVWTRDQKRWCCSHFQMGCSDENQKPTYDAGDDKYWKWDTEEWKPAKVQYDCDAYLEQFDLMWGPDQKGWCCTELKKGCSDHDKQPKYPAGNGFFWSWAEEKGWEQKEQKFDCSKDVYTFEGDQETWCCKQFHKGCPYIGNEQLPQKVAAPKGSEWVQVLRNKKKFWDLMDV